MKAIFIVKDIAEDKSLDEVFEDVFDSYKIIPYDQDIISAIYIEPPDIILVDGRYVLESDNAIIKEFRSNTIFGNLPIVAVMHPGNIEGTAWQDIPIDDFIITDENPIFIKRRLEFIFKRSVRELDTNPLTRLPGNESIIRHMQDMFDQGSKIAIAWVDLDNFKPFNDRYGFSRGDEVLLATARIITNVTKEMEIDDVFVGHVGGDDFVFICPIESIRRLCEEIILCFDMVIKNFYNDDDLEQGFIISKGRDGLVKKFPIMTISISVVLNEDKRYTHYGQASQEATDIKEYVKGLEGSNYMIDRRETNK